MTITISLTNWTHIGENPDEYLFSGGHNSRDRIRVSLHDVIFDNSDKRHHVVTIQILLKVRINILVNDKVVPEDLMNVKYRDLCELQKRMFVMPYLSKNSTMSMEEDITTIHTCKV